MNGATGRILAAALLLSGLVRPVPASAAPAQAAEDAVASHAGAWLGTCDNLRNCALFGFADDDSAVLMLRLLRDRSPAGTLLLRPEHPLRTEVVHLQVGRRGGSLVLRASGTVASQMRAPIDPAQLHILLPQLRQTGRVFLSAPSGRGQGRIAPLGAIRLAGAAAVLDWVARMQNCPPAPRAAEGAFPPPDPSQPPDTLPAVVAALPAVRACARLDSTRPDQRWPGVGLSARTVLWRVPCGSGNFSQDSLFVLADGDRVAPATFPSPPQFPERPPGILVNAERDENGVLSATEPSRGLEDCGDVRRYRWDGARFQLVWAQLMPACHGLGVEDWPVVYRANPPAADGSSP